MKQEPGQPHAEDTPACWVLTTDHRSARLLLASLTPHDRLHIDERAQLDEEWDEFQHIRPSPRAGKDNHAYASPGHEEEERAHRFAKAVATWVDDEMRERQIAHLHAFSSPRFLGQLRKVLSQQTQAQVTDHALDLAPLRPGELALHEAVIAVLRGDGATSL